MNGNTPGGGGDAPCEVPRAPSRTQEPRTWAPPRQQPAFQNYYERPRSSSLDDRRARLPSDLSDGVTEASYASDTPWGYQQSQFADRGAASLLATLDVPAWHPQQQPRRLVEDLSGELRHLGLSDPKVPLPTGGAPAR